MLNSNIDDASLAQAGAQRISWYRDRMTVLSRFKERYEKDKPFRGKRLLICMHCEPKGAVRTEVILAGGAEHITFIGNLGSTKPDTAAYLSTLPNVTVLARRDDTLSDLEKYASDALLMPYDLMMDNGALLMRMYDKSKPLWTPDGAIEETRSGQLILEKENIVPEFPILVIDDSPVKRLVENEAGVGQSIVDGFMRATSMLVGGKKILIIGYGYCGTGISQRFRALGASTMVYDVEPLRMLKAKIEGHIAMPLEKALAEADVVVTVTGRFGVIGLEQIALMKNHAILCNAGHYNMEIDVAAMRTHASSIETMQDGVQKFVFGDKDIALLQNANPLNLSCGAGNPMEIMELGYALQLLSLEQLMSDKKPRNGILPLPKEINDEACSICLQTWE